MTEQEIKVREKQQVSSGAEQTRTGPVFTPAVDIFETEKKIVVLADMPGVKPGKLDIDLREDRLTLVGEVASFEKTGEKALLTEYEVGTFYRQFTLSEVIDQEKIEAGLENGVLTLTLPKVEKAKPRKITVSAG